MIDTVHNTNHYSTIHCVIRTICIRYTVVIKLIDHAIILYIRARTLPFHLALNTAS